MISTSTFHFAAWVNLDKRDRYPLFMPIQHTITSLFLPVLLNIYGNYGGLFYLYKILQ
jgi:hypothetical protein